MRRGQVPACVYELRAICRDCTFKAGTPQRGRGKIMLWRGQFAREVATLKIEGSFHLLYVTPIPTI